MGLAGARTTRGLVSVALAFALSHGESARTPAGEDEEALMPGPRTAPHRADPVADNARCEGCHADVAAEWRSSLHHASYDDPSYQRALATEPTPFCRGCHAPEASEHVERDREPPADRASLGVACVTCHATGGDVLAAPSSERSGAPHGVMRDARFATAAACAGCHEFTFPSLGPRPRDELMQATVHEHEASTYAASACAGCHMPRVSSADGRGHRSHAFSASRDERMIRSAATVRARRATPTGVRVTLEADAVGHAFPTGDLFRRLRVVAEIEGDPRAPRMERHLMRRFGEHRIGLASERTQVSDDRVEASGAPRVVDLDLGPAAVGRSIHYWVDYERVEHPLSRDGEEAVVEGRIAVAEGVVSASPEGEGTP